MNFDVYGPFELPRTKAGLIDDSIEAKNAFWTGVEQHQPGLSSSCGVYIYCVSAKRGMLPWYVGLAQGQALGNEALATRQSKLYERALEGAKGKLKVAVHPCLFLLPLLTPKKRGFARPSANGRKSVQSLEKFLIGVALARNDELLNLMHTRFLKSACIPAVLNSKRGKPTKPARQLRSALYA